MNNKPTIKLSFDVEFWNEGRWLQPYITDDMLAHDPFPASMEKILQALKKYNAQATFFVTLAVTKKYPDIIKDIASNGHEIGVHGPDHIPLCDYTPDGFKKDCVEQIALLEQITGEKPAGFRAAHFSLSPETMWVLPALKELGFTYDSSLFPRDMGQYGIANAPLIPHEIIPGLLEVPISVAEFFGIRIPFAGGIYFRFLPFFIFKFLTNRSAKTTTPILYFHPHELDATTPQIKTGPWFYRWLKYLGVKKSFGKFEKLLEQFDCKSLQNG